MAKQKLVPLLTIILCISILVSGCGGVDLSTPRSTVDSYIKALEKYDYEKVGQCLGVKPASFPKGPDLEFRNIRIAVLSQTDTEAIVYAEWEVWAEVQGMMLPTEEGMYFEFELIKQDDKWIIADMITE